ncbi:MAG TPA: aldo/keto reductase [Steroidobacteraceae bacterium]|nr:aldo/keto reductase [Steroidobacteraceae bacterium]
MNAAVQQALRPSSWQTAEPSALAPETSRVLPSGNRMPLLGLGTWELQVHTTETVCSALELGFRMLDSSPEYHTQRGIGAAIRACGFERHDIYVITQVEPLGDAYAALHKNLSQLKLDYVDLVLFHLPKGDHRDDAGELAWQGLRRAKRDGLTRDIGVSGYSIEPIEELVYRTGEMPAVNQIEWSPFGHSPRMLDFCRDNDIVIQARSPLTRATRLNDDKVAAMAARYGKTPAQLLIRWNLQIGVVPLPKANHVQHLRENLGVFNFEITPVDMARLNALNEHYSVRQGLPYV